MASFYDKADLDVGLLVWDPFMACLGAELGAVLYIAQPERTGDVREMVEMGGGIALKSRVPKALSVPLCYYTKPLTPWNYDGMARRFSRLGHFRAGQVHRESAGRARIL